MKGHFQCCQFLVTYFIDAWYITNQHHVLQLILEETSMIKGHAETMEKIEDLEKRIPLDRPEQFLFEMSQVPQLEERIACFIFEDTFKG